MASEDEFMQAIDEMTAAGDLEVVVTQNTTGEDHCTYCHDTGWVALRRVTHDFGATYDEWAAPCIFCEEGVTVEACQRTGIDYRHGAGKPKEQQWRAKDIDTAYQTTDVIASHCAVCGPRVLTFDEYLGTEVGQADPHAGGLQRMLAAKHADGLTRAVEGPGSFASLAVDSIDESPTEERDP
jgi:hypothetical protein